MYGSDKAYGFSEKIKLSQFALESPRSPHPNDSQQNPPPLRPTVAREDPRSAKSGTKRLKKTYGEIPTRAFKGPSFRATKRNMALSYLLNVCFH